MEKAASKGEIDPEYVRKKECFDFIQQEDSQIQKYLAEDRNNFVIKLANVEQYECWSMDYLKKLWTVDRPDLKQPYYKIWYECKSKDNIPSSNNVIKDVEYVKVSSFDALVKKPYWFYEGPPPEPRIFELIETNKIIKTLTVNDMLEGTLIDYQSGDHCNTKPHNLYKLVLFGHDENDKLYNKFWQAVDQGNIDQVNEFIKLGLDINKPDDDDVTPLLKAAQEGYLEVVLALLNAGAIVNITHGSNDTPLYTAAQNGHIEVVRILIKNGASMDNVKERGFLFSAAKNGNIEVLQALFEAGINVESRDKYLQTPLYIAAKNRQVEAVKLLAELGADVETPNKYGKTPLYNAAYNGHVEVVRVLAELGANVETPGNDGATPAFVAGGTRPRGGGEGAGRARGERRDSG